MIMYDLVRKVTHENMRVRATLSIISAAPYWTADVMDRQGRMVCIFWVSDSEGRVCQVWEHTMQNLPRFGVTGDVRYMD